MTKSPLIKNHKKRFYWIIVLGIGVSLFLFLREINSVQFQLVEKGSGTHIWAGDEIDKINYNDENNFIESVNGNFIRISFLESIQKINFNFKTFLGLFFAISMMFFRDFFYTLRIRLLTDKVLHWKKYLRVILIWEFVSAVSPGVVGGSAVAMFILKREKIPIGKSTSVVFITAIFDNLFFIIFAPIFLFFLTQTAYQSSDFLGNEGVNFFWLGYLILLAITCFLFFFVFVSPHTFQAIVKWVFKIKFLKKHIPKVEQFGKDLKETAKEMKGKNFIFWLKLLLFTIFSWFARYLVINFIFWAFVDIGFVEHISILGRQFLMWIVLLITPTPGGTGMAEFLFSELLRDFSSSAGLLMVLILLWRIISYYPYLLIGSFLISKKRRK